MHGARRSNAGRGGGWLIGPTWLYVLAAIAMFAAAAAVAVVQATSSDDSADQGVAQIDSVEPAAQSQDRESTGSAEPNPAAAPAQQAEAEQQPIEQPQSVTETQPSPEPEQADESIQTEQEQSQPQQLPDEQEPDNPLRGFVLPIASACISEHPGHLPGAPRTYRNDGIHEGLDFYQWASCTTIDYGTEILAAKAGVVVRADLDYVEITPDDWQRFIDANWQGEKILDELRGRQVHIDHGRGIVTRYAHLSAIANGIAVGVEVRQGQVIGYPGESGQQEVYANPGTDIHLHFEIRVGDGWLGQGETQETALTLYRQAFGLVD